MRSPNCPCWDRSSFFRRKFLKEAKSKISLIEHLATRLRHASANAAFAKLLRQFTPAAALAALAAFAKLPSCSASTLVPEG